MDTLPGRPYPLGASLQPEGVNFCVYSHNCTALELLLFDQADDPSPACVIRLDPRQNRTFYYWHIYIKGLQAGHLYGYRAYGPFIPEKGLRFDGSKILVDPYARAVAYGDNYSRQAARIPGDNCASAMKSVALDPRHYDWEGDVPLRRPYANSLIYELHVGGFTRHPNSGIEPARRGTYAGLIEKIPYLVDLGVTAVELMPIQQFDPQDALPPLENFWGYSPVAFFAPHRGYSSRQDVLGPVDEFRDMVKALHRSGIEVILDVVFNHTAEGDHLGPTLSFRGLENRAYYFPNPNDLSRYANFSGCGNTVNANHSVVRRLILDCLRYWVQVMHVDGVRFDLASVMSRDEHGQPLENPPILWEIESDPVLASTKIIAEAWDAAGLYQVGSFIGHRWAEWNSQFRDDVRRFVKGDSGTVVNLANRIAGSRDLFRQPDREPNRSINLITCHDGFTLNDLVSYNEKHNLANGENNRDGMDHNFSWNCGVEGPTCDPAVEGLRVRQIKNFISILLTSQGTPMMLMGDEIRRSQGGNNNAYCQNNEMTWFNWEGVQSCQDIWRFIRCLIHFTQNTSVFNEENFWTDPGGPEVVWHGVHLNAPDWRVDSHSLAYELLNPEKGEHLHIMLNAYWEPLTFEVPALILESKAERHWRQLVDTAMPTPQDYCELDQAPSIDSGSYTLQPRSTVILVEQ